MTDYKNEILNDCYPFAERHRGKCRTSGPHWSTIIRFVKLFDEAVRLQERVQELEQERQWIPVSERLPEDTMIYDVAIAGYPYSWTGSCVFGKWIGESGKAILGVTYWKYRPQPPQEEVAKGERRNAK